jgi:hypothetical protein
VRSSRVSEGDSDDALVRDQRFDEANWSAVVVLGDDQRATSRRPRLVALGAAASKPRRVTAKSDTRLSICPTTLAIQGDWTSIVGPQSIRNATNVDRERPGHFVLQQFVTSIPRFPATLPFHYKPQS